MGRNAHYIHKGSCPICMCRVYTWLLVPRVTLSLTTRSWKEQQCPGIKGAQNGKALLPGAQVSRSWTEQQCCTSQTCVCTYLLSIQCSHHQDIHDRHVHIPWCDEVISCVWLCLCSGTQCCVWPVLCYNAHTRQLCFML